jgi:hypothetical protein
MTNITPMPQTRSQDRVMAQLYHEMLKASIHLMDQHEAQGTPVPLWLITSNNELLAMRGKFHG